MRAVAHAQISTIGLGGAIRMKNARQTSESPDRQLSALIARVVVASHWVIVIKQDAFRSAIEVFVLTALERPQKGSKTRRT